MLLTLPAQTDTETTRDRWHLLPWLLAAVFFVLYTLLSVTNHLRLATTGYDLGIFEQAVRAYSEGRAPVSPLKGPGYVLLGDHFHPILATLAPFYRVFPSPITLLVAQAVLLAVSAVPIVRLLLRRFGGPTALAVGVAYGLSWGLQTTVDFDFHEVVFAVPLLAFSLERLVTQRWTGAVLWAAPLILVKEDLPLTFAAIGGYLILKKQRRLGAWVLAGGVGSFLLILLVLIPAFNPGNTYDFADQLGKDTSTWQLILEMPERLFESQTKLVTLMALLAPTAFLAVSSPIALLAIPTLLWRFLSTNPSYWGVGFHYSAVLMPIMYLALADALTHGQSILPVRTFTRVRRTVIGVSIVLAVAGFTSQPLGKLTEAETWQRTSRVVDANRLLDVIPDGATVAASNNLAPQLTSRCTVTLFPARFGKWAEPDWIIVDTHFVNWPLSAQHQADSLQRLRTTDYRTVAETPDFVLLHKTRGSP